MTEEFITFQRFGDRELAESLVGVLEAAKIDCRFEDQSSSLDSSFGGGGFTNEYVVKLQKDDFEKANAVLIEHSIADLDSIGDDYYLFSFSDDELRDVIAHNDEWSRFDSMLAQKLLKDRGHEIDQNELRILKQQRIEELSQPEKPQTTAIIAGYILAVLGGLVGIFIGWYLSSQKKTLPNGDRVFSYREADRRQGKNMMYLGILFLVFWIVMRIFGLWIFAKR